MWCLPCPSRRLASGALAFLVLALLCGCDQVKLKRKKPAPPPAATTGAVATPAEPGSGSAAPAPAEPVYSDEARAYARRRLEEEVAKAPPFDRNAAIQQLLHERFGIDAANLYPQGFDEITTLTEAQMKELLEERLKEMADVKFAPSVRERMAQQAEQEYPLYKVGDTLTITTLRNERQTGKLTALQNARLWLDDREFLVRDVVQPNPRCFDPQETEKYRQFFIRKHYDDPRNEYQRQIRPALVKEIFVTGGYVYDPQRRQWFALKQVLQEEVKPAVDAREEAYKQGKLAAITAAIREELQTKGLLPPEPAAPANR